MDVRTCPTGNFRHAEVSEALGATGEVFQIDDLLDFSNDDVLALIDGCDEENASEETSPSASLDGNYSPENDNNQVADMPLGGELCVPMDSLADLEWLSNFVEDSFSVAGLGELPSCAFLSVDGKTERKVSSFDDDCNDENKAKKQRNCERNNNSLSSCNFSQWIPVRARRSKRSRTGGRVWTSCPLLPSNPGFESHSSIFTSANQSSDSSSNNSSVTSYSSSFSRPPPAKKHKANNNHSHAVKKTQDVVAAGGQTRRCSHCLVQKTPQWRAGPLGPKTLCNACGVRFKSGRLLPEYRPAVSPTFHNEVHSNSHRKVLELRRQKEEEHKIFHLPQNVSEAEFFVKKEALYLKEMIFEQKNQQHMYGGEISVKKESPYPPKEMMISEQQKNQQHNSGGEISVKKESPYPPKEMLLLKQENQHISEGAIFVKQESVISVKEEQQSGGI